MPEITPTPYIFDVQGVLSWSRATGNEATIILGDVQSGVVLIFGRVITEFCNVYSDEAKALPLDQIERQVMTDEHRAAAAALAASVKATFGRKGPYDRCVEWCVAGIASCGPYTIVTDERRKPQYEKIDGVSVITFTEFLERH